MNILDKIAADKHKEIQLRQEIIPASALELMPLFGRKCFSLSQKLQESSTGIIAEFKRRSPSRPNLNPDADIELIVPAYQKAGASGISVLTDELYFGGTMDDFFLARQQVEIPILRKDFIIDEYQILESKAIGADVILLIASLLSPAQIKTFSETAKNLGLEVLLEVHDLEELERSLQTGLDMVGVNNRNLKTFTVDTDISKKLSGKIPDDFVKVSESGISMVSSIRELRAYGYKGFLIGENFMKSPDPRKSAMEFIKTLLQ